jgi:hypothetical protein
MFEVIRSGQFGVSRKLLLPNYCLAASPESL